MEDYFELIDTDSGNFMGSVTFLCNTGERVDFLVEKWGWFNKERGAETIDYDVCFRKCDHRNVTDFVDWVNETTHVKLKRVYKWASIKLK